MPLEGRFATRALTLDVGRQLWPAFPPAHRCFIGKPRKPCCGHRMKAALVVLTGRHSQQQIACLPVVPIGKQAQIRNIVVGHLSGWPLCEYTTAHGARAEGLGLRTAADQESAPATCVRVVLLQLVKSFAMDRAKANVNPPAAAQQITGADT
jgi:hypothetical protein